MQDIQHVIIRDVYPAWARNRSADPFASLHCNVLFYNTSPMRVK